jgi:type I restriction enzyme S subunit
VSLTIAPARIVEESGSPLLACADSWQRRPLGEVASILNGFAFASTNFTADAGKQLIRIRDIFNSTTAISYLGEYDDRYLVQPGDLLVGMDGDFNSARWHGTEALLNQRVCKVTPDPKLLDIEFLTSLLPGYLKAIHDLTSSTTVTHLSSRDVAQLPVPVPPLDEQRAIAKIIRSVGDRSSKAVQHLSMALRATERFRQSVLAAACSGRLTGDLTSVASSTESTESARAEVLGGKKPRSQKERPVDFPMPSVPGHYSVSTIGDCADLIQYGTSLRCDPDPEVGIPVLRMGNIQGGSLDLTDLKYCRLVPELERLFLQDGDVLFNRTNSPELVGKSAVFHSSKPTSFASYLIRVRLNTEVADPDFVNYWINSAWGRAWSQLAKTDGVSQSNINGSKLSLMPIPLPPIAEQHAIVARVSAMLGDADALLVRLKSARQAVERSRQSLLAKAFRGELASLGVMNIGDQ